MPQFFLYLSARAHQSQQSNRNMLLGTRRKDGETLLCLYYTALHTFRGGGKKSASLLLFSKDRRGVLTAVVLDILFYWQHVFQGQSTLEYRKL